MVSNVTLSLGGVLRGGVVGHVADAVRRSGPVNPFSQFKNNYITEMCSGSEAGSYLRLIDFAYHSTLGLRVIRREEEKIG